MMGIQHDGAFGGFVNKTGPLVGRRVNGQNVITALPHPSLKAPTQPQLDVRFKFKLIVSWLSWIAILIRVGWNGQNKEKQTPMNAAVRYHYDAAIMGTSPNFSINYSKVFFSRGRLSEAGSPTVSTVEAMSVKFSWSASVNTGFGGPTDQVTVLLYNLERDSFVFLTGAAPRSALSYDLDVPMEYTGETVQCWIGFVSADGKMVSNSTYLGTVNIL